MRRAPGFSFAIPEGGGLFSFALAHGGIECKRSLTPEWRVSDADLETLRELAREAKIKFTVARYVQRSLPGAPKKKTPQKQVELFPERES